MHSLAGLSKHLVPKPLKKIITLLSTAIPQRSEGKCVDVLESWLMSNHLQFLHNRVNNGSEIGFFSNLPSKMCHLTVSLKYEILIRKYLNHLAKGLKFPTKLISHAKRIWKTKFDIKNYRHSQRIFFSFMTDKNCLIYLPSKNSLSLFLSPSALKW